ncbi:hypothetical protein SpiGrapes_1783 [Sphaerochaeta pleomorpha str. Grapes]|uniref:Uncharacterized protein n=2 Tax=Sphaerochaeta TaxID=399320 RepID=G8QXL6_SPHPG|nr:hypothetical protein SpiGrapes_1783 [Sphaerochaeta pleomorpha str. Grapes]
MGILLGLGFILLCVIVYFLLPYSPTKTEFERLAQQNFSFTEAGGEVFSEADIASLPLPVQRYFRHCGFIGKAKMQGMKATFKNVAFSLGRDKPTIAIDYTQYNAVAKPERIAYIDSSIYRLPFEGLDSFVAGKGSMKGVLGKMFTLFNQKGNAMGSASLVTMLSECLFVPSSALQDYISWESIDDTHAKATIAYYNFSCSGVFTFSEEGEMIYFSTDDRMATSMDGKMEQVRWTAHCGNYHKVDDLLLPSLMQASWNYSEGDLLYFDSDNVNIEYF